MARRYGDAVTVRGSHGGSSTAGHGLAAPDAAAPAEFLWRGRLYVVREVLAHWVEAGAWWESETALAVVGAEWGDTGGGAASATAPAGGLATAVEDAERRVWRVEASAGRFHGAGVYDLAVDTADGAWTLTRVLD